MQILPTGCKHAAYKYDTTQKFFLNSSKTTSQTSNSPKQANQRKQFERRSQRQNLDRSGQSKSELDSKLGPTNRKLRSTHHLAATSRLQEGPRSPPIIGLGQYRCDSQFMYCMRRFYRCNAIPLGNPSLPDDACAPCIR